VNDDFPRTLKLEDDFTGDKSTTVSRYPEFCGKDRKDVQYSLKVIKETDGLHLWVYETNATIDNSAKQKIEVPYKDKLSNGKTIREWRLERTYMYRFAKRGIIKNIFIEVSARQVDENSLEILNWKDGKNSLGDNALTCLKYPEFKGKYVTK